MVIAYIDAASGSMVLQVLIAGAVAIPFFFRNAITAAVRRVRGERRTDSGAGRTPPEST